jgi:hypothetical protein
MEKFVKLDNILINVDRLISVKHEPDIQTRKIEQSEHYMALFDTGQLVMLSVKDGTALIERCQRLYTPIPSEGTMATTSESAI